MFRHHFILTVSLLIIFGWISTAPVTIHAAPKKKPPETVPTAPGVLKSETNMVLVNVIVTDKQGQYLKDIKREEFHVFEDGKEQHLTSFTREAGFRPGTSGSQGNEEHVDNGTKPGAPARPRYLVLFFDDVSLFPEGQMYEREEALKFVESTASPNRRIAIISYNGTLHLDQNFTADRERLKKALSKVQLGKTPDDAETIDRGNPNARSPLQEYAFSVRAMLSALRGTAEMLGTAPGRKTIIFLSGGIPVAPDSLNDFKNTIDALNKANVGVYTVAALGLEGPRSASAAITTTDRGGENQTPPGLLPLAVQTGGFAIVNNNDLQGRMEKVSQEMDEYYTLGYLPPHPVHNGSYHRIRVKIDRAGAEVRARSGYYDTKSPDVLAGKSEGNVLEAQAASFEPGKIPVSLSLPYFYTGAGIARVNLALSIPGSALIFRNRGGGFQAQVDILGIASRDDGSVAARFSDKVLLDYGKNGKRTALSTDFEYKNSFKIPPGVYTLKLVLGTGKERFGKYVVPLAVDPFSDKQFILSGPAFGSALEPCPMESADMDQALIEGSMPMVANGMQVVPSSGGHFKQGGRPVVYVEVYDPLLESTNLLVLLLFDIVNRKTMQKVYSSDAIPLNGYIHAGNPLVPVIFKLPADKLAAGDYRIEIQGRDSVGNVAPVRTGDFSIE